MWSGDRRTSNEKSLNVCKNRKVVARGLKHKHRKFRTDTLFNIIYITRNKIFPIKPGCRADLPVKALGNKSVERWFRLHLDKALSYSNLNG